VRSVEVKADDASRLKAFVALVPGRPLDHEAVRRAVELMFATGRFEDVRVELVRYAGEQGVDVVFRPVPAPLLADVRVEGDRVISAGAITRLTRLRPGEPLWPSRLERAGREVALALARRGRLEALVVAEARRLPRGADAVFHVHAGPSAHVLSVRVTAEAALAAQLSPLAAPRPGRTYEKDKAEAAREAMRRSLVAAGYWRAHVELQETYDPTSAAVALVFQAQPGARTRLALRGAELDAGLVSQVRALVREGGASFDSLEAGAERIESALRAEGHRDALVSAGLEPDGAAETAVFDVRAGEAAHAGSVELRGADPSLLAGLRTQPGEPLQDAALSEDARLLRSRLEALGYYEARVDADVADGGGILPVVFVARPGPLATVSELQVIGPPLPVTTDERGPGELAVREGQPYRVADVARSREALVEAWRRAGFLEARVRADSEFSEARDAARVVLTVEPGQRTIVEHVVLAGLDHTRDATVEREIQLRPG